MSVATGNPMALTTLTGPGNKPADITAAVAKVTSKRVHHGVECVGGMVWRGLWTAGESLTKVLLLKNIHPTVKKLKFRYPKTKSFRIDYPREVSLPPGTSTKIPVIFTADERSDYTDKIEFILQTGETFRVDLLAIPPSANITMPASLDLGMCCLGMTQHRTIDITNSSAVGTHFLWSTLSPFAVEPVSGFLKAKKTVTCTFSFSPEEALAFNETTYCRFTVNSSDTDFKGYTQLDLHGVGKMPRLIPDIGGEGASDAVHFGTNLQTLHFGDVNVDTECIKYMQLRNTTPVLTSYQLAWSDGKSCDGASVFNVPTSLVSGSVEAMTSIRIPVQCRPQRVGMTGCHTLILNTVGHTEQQRIQCTVNAIGPKVQPSVSHVAFPCQPVGQQLIKTFTLRNTSSAPGIFEFTPPCAEIFQVIPQRGVVDGHSQTIVQVVFRPSKAFCFSRLLTCMVHHQEPIFINLIGTGYTEQVRPVELLPIHLEQMRSRLLDGLAGLGPETLHQLVIAKKLKPRVEQRLDIINSEGIPLHTPSQSIARLTASNFITHAHHSSYCLTGVDRWHIDFGAVTTAVSEAEPLTLVNTTSSAIVVQWITEPGCLFSIKPAARAVEPKESCYFHVKFEPGRDAKSRLHSSTLECFCMYRAMLDQDRVKQPFHAMGWSFAVTVTAHAFKFKEEISRAVLKADHDSVVSVTPTVVGKPAHGTVLVENTGSVPAQFTLPYTPAQPITVWPSAGTVQPGQYKVLMVRAVPHKDEWSSVGINMTVNHHLSQELTVVTSAERPHLEIESQNKFCHFSTVCCGHIGERQVQVTNTTSAPIFFHWAIELDQNFTFSTEPEEGYIAPHETQTHHFFNLPRGEGRALVTATLEYCSAVTPASREDGVVEADQHHNEAYRDDVTLVATAIMPKLEAEYVMPKSGHIVVNNGSRHQVRVRNDHCAALVPFRLVFSTPEHIKVDVSPAVAQLAPGTQTTFTVSIWAMEKGKATVDVYAVFIDDLGEPLDSVAPQMLCSMKTKAVYPHLQVTNVAGTGSAERVEKRRLWQMTGVEELNKLVKKKPTAGERAHDTVTRTSTRISRAFSTPANVVLNLGTALYASQPSTVYWQVENTTLVECYWQIAYPTDMQLEVDSWAEELLSSSEAQTFHYLKSGTFAVSPKSGCLLPGQSSIIKFKYEHHIVGENMMDVVLKIREGREVKLELRGVTVPEGTPYPMWPSRSHTFQPVAVRCKSPPIQPFTLYNDGTSDIRYTVDETLITRLNQVCAGHSPLTCRNPCGVIPAMGCVDVQFVFSPRSVNSYKFEIGISTHNSSGRIHDDDDNDDSTSTQHITLYGSSFDYPVRNEKERVELAAAIGKDLFKVQSRPLSRISKVASLSNDVMVLGAFPIVAKATQPVWINSAQLSHDQRFTWHVPDTLKDQVTIIPATGVVGAEQSVMCQFEVICQDVKVIETDVTCELVDVQADAQYEKDLSEWKLSRLEDTVHFTITEKDMMAEDARRNAASTTLTTLGHHGDMAVKLDGTTRWPTGRTTIHRASKQYTYKSLPPAIPVYGQKIPDQYESWKKSDMSTRSTSRPRKQQVAGKALRPTPPRSTVLHLFVTGRSYLQDDFSSLFPSLASSYPSARADDVPQVSDIADETIVTDKRNDIVVAKFSQHIANKLLQDLLESQDFQSSLAEVADAPVCDIDNVLSGALAVAAADADAAAAADAATDAAADAGASADRRKSLKPSARQQARVPLPTGKSSTTTETESSLESEYEQKIRKHMRRWGWSSMEYYQKYRNVLKSKLKNRELYDEDELDSMDSSFFFDSEPNTYSSMTPYRETAAVSEPSSPQSECTEEPSQSAVMRKLRQVGGGVGGRVGQADDHELWKQLSAVVADIVDEVTVSITNTCLKDLAEEGLRPQS
eukprot:scpid12333/ scgid8335/ Coiled-coil domain-containing protein 108